MREMKKVRLGRTGLMVTKTSFGALPIQRISKDDAAELLRTAYEAGINFFDTANSYTDSEEKIGYALSDVRKNIIIATKSAYDQGNPDMVKRNLELSLKRMKTDYVDILQFHNPSFLPREDDPAYRFLQEMKAQGWFGTSASPTTAPFWPGRQWKAASTTPSSSPSRCFPARRTLSWWSCARRRMWASSP